jgi:hypothetical protein
VSVLQLPGDVVQRVAHREHGGYYSGVKLQEIEHEALWLSERERAELVLSLLGTLRGPKDDINDEEVSQRDAELETGSVEPMLHEEFVRRVQEERGR